MIFRDDRDILDQFSNVKSSRSTLEGVWRSVDRNFRPDPSGQQLNNAGVWATSVAVSALFAYLTPPGTRWMMAVPDNLDDAKRPDVAKWLYWVRDAVFGYLTRGRLKLYSLLPGLYRQLVTAGMGVLCTEWSASDFHLFARGYTEFYPMYDAYGNLVACYREYVLQSHQAEKLFGKLPDNAPRGGNVMNNLTFQQCVYEDGTRWVSKHFYANELMQQGFFFDFPWVLPRYQIDEPGDPFSLLSPAIETVGDTRMLQALELVHLRAAQKATDPPVLAYRAAQKLRGVALDPGVMIPSDRLFATARRPEFEPVPASNPNVTWRELERVERRVERSFMVDVMRTLTSRGDSSPLKAEEVIGRRQEGLSTFSPVVLRLGEEFLIPLCNRIYREMQRQRFVPEAPAGVEPDKLRWTFTSAAAMAVRSSDIDALTGWLTRISPLLQVDPNAAKRVDISYIMGQMAELHGVDPAVMVDQDTFDEQAQMSEQIQAMQAVAPAAADTAGALKDLRTSGLL